MKSESLKRLLFSISFIVFLTVSAQAADPLAIAQKSHPQSTKYELLRELYEEAVQPAAPSDFELCGLVPGVIVCSPSYRCGAVEADEADKMLSLTAVRVREVISPSAGPLFPETDLDLVSALNQGDEIQAEMPMELVRDIHNRSTTTDLEVLYASSATNPYFGIEKYRKNSDFIVFLQNLTNSKTKKPFQTYGYCWKK